ncbi:hypothetical protein DSECCO2_635310 [anaerobic digester metagenome]
MEAHVVAHEAADEVGFVGREAQAREDLARHFRADLVVLEEVQVAAGVFGGVQLAHVVEQTGQRAVPVVGQLFGVVAHDGERLFEQRVFDAFLGFLFDAGEGGHFRQEPVQDHGVVEQFHERGHVFGLDLAPLVHDVLDGHVVEDAARGAQDGHEGVGFDRDVVVGREAQGAHGAQIVLAQGLVRDADQAHLARGQVGEAVVGVELVGEVGAGLVRRQDAQGVETGDKAAGEPGHGLLGVGGVGGVGRVEVKKRAVLQHARIGAAGVHGLGVGKELLQLGQGRVGGEVEFRRGLVQGFFLQHGVYDVGVVAVAHDGLADGGGVLEGLRHGYPPKAFAGRRGVGIRLRAL